MTNCPSCNAKCGAGKANIKTSDEILMVLCRILCQTRQEFCKGKHKGKTASSVAENKAKNSKALDKAIQKKYGSKATKAINKHKYVKFNKNTLSPEKLKRFTRKVVSKSTLDKHLNNVIKQIKNQALKTAGTKAAKKAATAWIKLVPVLGWASTAYDIYDLATVGVDMYKAIEKAKQQFTGDVYSVRPDIAIAGEHGNVQDIYDFKFDSDDWNDGQKELYDELLDKSGSESNQAKSVNGKDCECDNQNKVSSKN